MNNAADGDGCQSPTPRPRPDLLSHHHYASRPETERRGKAAFTWEPTDASYSSAAHRGPETRKQFQVYNADNLQAFQDIDLGRGVSRCVKENGGKRTAQGKALLAAQYESETCKAFDL